MYACYIDESGHCGEKYDPNQPVEVLCGVITDVTKLFKTKREHNEIMKVLASMDIHTTEFKAREIYRGLNPWSKVDPANRRKIIEFLLNWSHERNCKYIICPIDSQIFFKLKSDGCPISQKLCFPYEAGCMNIILAIQRLNKGKKSNKGKTWIIFDEQNSHDKRIAKIFDSDLEYTDGYTGFNPKSKKESRLDEIIDIPFFSKSHRSIVIQVADLVAYIVNRYLLLTVYKKTPSYPEELNIITGWYIGLKESLISYNNINPPAKDDLTKYFQAVRPEGWSIRKWTI